MLVTGLTLLLCSVPVHHSCSYLYSLCVRDSSLGDTLQQGSCAVSCTPDLLPGDARIQRDCNGCFLTPYGDGLADPFNEINPPMSWEVLHEH